MSQVQIIYLIIGLLHVYLAFTGGHSDRLKANIEEGPSAATEIERSIDE